MKLNGCGATRSLVEEDSVNRRERSRAWSKISKCTGKRPDAPLGLEFGISSSGPTGWDQMDMEFLELLWAENPSNGGCIGRVL